MKLEFSAIARDRSFDRAMRRVRPRLQPVLDAFERIELQHPIHEAILVGITDDKAPGFIEEIENNDGFFQVICGCSDSGSDNELLEAILGILRQSFRLCPFATSDHEEFEKLFAEMHQLILEEYSK